MNTSRFPAATALLSAVLFSWMLAPAPARAAQLVSMGQMVYVGETNTPGTLSGLMEFDVSPGPFTPPATVHYQVKLMPANISIGSGTFVFSVFSEPTRKMVGVTFNYSALPADGSGSIVFTPTSASGIQVQNSYGFFLFTNDITRRLTVSGGSVKEGNAGAGAGSLPFTITMNKVLTAPLTFSLTGSGGTAVAGQDYDATPGTATIPAGQTSVTVNLNITGDSAVEENETVGLALSDFSQLAMMNTTQTHGVIQTDDYPPGAAASPVTVTELPGTGTAQAWFAVDLPAARVQPYLCDIRTRDGTAVNGTGHDYVGLSTRLTFAPGETRKWVSIKVTASAAVETREDFFLDVTDVDSQEVKSAACTIEPLTTSFERLAPDIYRVRFTAGQYQRYVVEESDGLSPAAAGWAPNSGILTGAGAVISHVFQGDAMRQFYRVTVLTSQPPGTAAASS